jgi:arylsulfatase A-like enzyme
MLTIGRISAVRLLPFGVAAFLVVAATAVRAVEMQRPNLVFILVDDLRWNTLGCMGDRLIQTPNIDRLAARGVLFRNSFVATSICCVSRASIFTGQHERRHGIGNFLKPLSPEQWAQTYPALLRQAGHRTGFVGKFGVGDAAAIKAKADAFDFWRGLPGQAGEFFIDPKDPTHTHATAKFGNQSLEFLRGCEPGKPFCLSLSFNAPHARDGKPREFQPDLRDEALYDGDTIPMPPTANEQFFKRLPNFVQRSECRRRWERRFATDAMFQRTMHDYYRLVTGIDREVGRIVDALATEKLAGNTVIIFTSDNGWFAGDRQLADKWLMYEESIRVPTVVFDPRLPESRRGRTVDAITLNTDFAPTLLDMAGLPVPSGMQGHSLVPLLSGEKPADWRSEFFYEYHYAPDIIPPSEGVRTERWSYIHWLPPNPELEELYDLQTDPLEAHNLAAVPQDAAMLTKLRGDWERSKRLLK